MASSSWDKDHAILVLERVADVFDHIVSWEGEVTKNGDPKKPLAQTLVTALKDHRKTMKREYKVSGPAAIGDALKSLCNVMKTYPEFLLEDVVANRAKIEPHFSQWTRRRAIEFMDKRIYKMLMDVETWYAGVSLKIDYKKNPVSASGHLWNKLTKYEEFFASRFNASQVVNSLNAIKSSLKSLVVYMEREPTMFVVSTPAANVSKGSAQATADTVRRPKDNQEPAGHNPYPQGRKTPNHTDNNRSGQPKSFPNESHSEEARYQYHGVDAKKWEQQLFQREHALERKEREMNKYSEDINRQMESMADEVTRLKAKNDELKKQLSQQTDTTKSPNDKQTNGFKKIKPDDIVADYKSLIEHEWSDATEEMEKENIPRGTAQHFLNNVLMTADTKAVELYSKRITELNAPLGIKSKTTVGVASLPQATVETLADFWAGSIDDANAPQLISMIGDGISSNFARYYQQAQTNTNLKSFVQKSAVLCWKMALQRPKMMFQIAKKGSKYDKTTQDVPYDSKDPSKYPVLYTVYPALYHGQQLKYKAKVICGK